MGSFQKILKPTKYRAVDTSGNNNHGKIYSGRGLEFDGVSDKLEHTSPSGLPSGNTFTMVAWVNYTGTSDDWPIWRRDAATDNPIFRLSATSRRVQLRKYGDETATADTSLEASTWYRVVLSIDNLVGTFYVNGIADGTHTFTGDFAHANESTIGQYDEYYATGMMSDVQIWDSAWSASDALFDYLNPESLALNNGGTSLTESNLKLWYPMQDGHRGQQSYILDGANTGLSDDIVSDGGFDTDVANGAASTSWTCASGTWSISDGVAKHETAGDTNQLRTGSGNVLTVGVSYKIEFDIVSITGGSITLDTDGASTPARSTVGTHTEYLTATNTFLDFTPDSSFAGTIDNVKIYPVNDKNHATTVFHGDDELSDHLIDSQKTELADNYSGEFLTFAGASTDGCDGSNGLGSEIMSTANDRGFSADANWTKGAGWTVHTGTSGKAVRSGADDSATSDLTHTGTGDAVADLFYLLQYDVDAIDDDQILAKFGGIFASKSGSSTTGTVQRIVRTTDTSKFSIQAGKNTNCTIDNISVKAIDGWLIRKSTAGTATASALAIDSGTLKVTNNGTTKGEIILPIIVNAGRVYRVKATCTAGSMKIGLDSEGWVSTDENPSFGSTITATATGYSGEVKADNIYNGTMMFITLQNGSASNNAVFNFDNLTIQEVGTATGWTDADQQLDISQTALQSYNQLAWFDGQHAYVNLDSSIATTTNDWSISFWLYFTQHSSSFIWPIGQTSAKNILIQKATNALGLYYRDEGTNYHVLSATTGSGSTIQPNKWLHIVVTADADTSMKGYINGQLEATNSDMTDTELIFRRFMAGYSTSSYLVNGSINEISYYNHQLTQAEVNELYNDGKAKDALTASAYYSDNLATTWANGTSAGFTTFSSNGNNITAATDENGGAELGCYGNTGISIPVVSGEVYLFEMDLTINSYTGSGLAVQLAGGASGSASNRSNIVYFTSSGKVSATLTCNATDAVAHVQLNTEGSNSDLIDFSASNITLRKIQLLGYWRNNGLSEWKDLKGSNDGNTVNTYETLLLPAGVDASRDNQGFIMNRQKDTNSLNLPGQLSPDVSFYHGAISTIEKASDVDYGDFDADGDGTGDFTLEFWTKFDHIHFRHNQCIFSNIYRDGSNNYAGVEITIDTAGQIDVVGAFDEAWSNLVELTTNVSGYNDNKWHHIVCVFDRSANFYLIIDNVCKGITDISSKSSASLWKFSTAIGAEKIPGLNHGVGRAPFDGEIDDLKIYNRLLTFYESDGSIPESGETITSGEVLRNYNAGKRSHR